MTLTEWRTVRCLSLRAAARELGISNVHLSKLEVGKVSPTLTTVDHIARRTSNAVTRRDWPESPCSQCGTAPCVCETGHD